MDAVVKWCRRLNSLGVTGNNHDKPADSGLRTNASTITRIQNRETKEDILFSGVFNVSPGIEL